MLRRGGDVVGSSRWCGGARWNGRVKGEEEGLEEVEEDMVGVWQRWLRAPRVFISLAWNVITTARGYVILLGGWTVGLVVIV